MGIRIIGEGDIVLKKSDVEIMRKNLASARKSVSNVAAELENGNGPSRDSQFQIGLYMHAEGEAKKAERFLDVIDKLLLKGT